MGQVTSDELEEYEPEPIHLADGEAAVLDPVELAEYLEEIGVRIFGYLNQEGALFVLHPKNGGLDWSNINTFRAKKANVRKIDSTVER